MRILLSSYWCSADHGSEQGVGWNFTEQLALQGHEVIVITQEAKSAVEEKYSKEAYPNITFIYFSIPSWLKKLIFRGTGPLAHLHYSIWQVYAYFFLKKYLSHTDIDLIHHITLGVFRTPVFLGKLGKPFIFGPVGGGEASTPQLQKNLPMKFKRLEKLRHLVNLTVLINPLCWIPFRDAQLVLLKTSDNLKYIPKRYHHKCKVSLEIGISSTLIKPIEHVQHHKQNFKILFAGRLEYWKGVHLAIKTYTQVLKEFPNTTFSIIGSGSDESWIKQVAVQEDVIDKINWLPRVPQKTLFEMYSQYDILLFPSLHDSSGGVVIEALAHGLPVVCLDLGGPKEIVDESCGSIIPTYGLSEKEVTEKLADSVSLLITEPERLAIMRHNALQKAKRFTWDQVVARTYELIKQQIFKTHLLVPATFIAFYYMGQL
jgi:glycosyltransferase involved in cell wall biosynthesis